MVVKASYTTAAQRWILALSATHGPIVQGLETGGGLPEG